MKRNCNGCKALLDESTKTKCDLGFKIKAYKEYEGLTVSFMPLEECPKPKTFSDYYYWLGLRLRGKSI